MFQALTERQAVCLLLRQKAFLNGVRNTQSGQTPPDRLIMNFVVCMP
jgi:hypothetical protein